MNARSPKRTAAPTETPDDVTEHPKLMQVIELFEQHRPELVADLAELSPDHLHGASSFPKAEPNLAERIRDWSPSNNGSRMFTALRITVCVCFLLVTGRTVLAQPSDAAVRADQALAKLMEGNALYARNKERHPDETLARRRELETTQHPFAVILSCSDSRVPPELIFDQGLGDLFVIRVAGNIIGDDELASIEYAVEHLGTELIVVLGHEKCGAVTAAVQGENDPGHLKALVSSIQPSVEETRNSPGDKVHNCVLANARRVARQIRESEPVLRELVEKGSVKAWQQTTLWIPGKSQF